MQFRYIAVSPDKKRISGTINVLDKASAISLLKEKKLIPLSIEAGDLAQGQPKSIWQMELTSNDIHKIKIKKKKLSNIIGQMAIMLKAGVTLLLCMDVLIESEKEKNVKKILTQVRADLYAGMSLSASLKKFAAFPQIMVSMVAAGEIDGRLDQAFSQVNQIFEKELQMTAKVKGALAYPAFLLVITIAVVGILNTLVLPTFSSLFSQINADLPAATRFMMAASDFINHYWMIFLLFIALLVLLYHLARKHSQAFCVWVDRRKMKTPLLGSLLHLSDTARLCRILSSMTSAGADIVTTLSIARSVIKNAWLGKAIGTIIEEVSLGNTIHSSMARQEGAFDSLLISMVRAGEESGYLSETLDKMSAMYQTRLDDHVKTLTALLEPAITVVMAVVVGFVVISVAMPMFGMYSAVSAM